MPAKRDLSELLESMLEAHDAGFRVGLPARVESYDAASQTCEVQPMLKDVTVDPDTGEAEATSLPKIPNVPVAFPRAGSFFMAWALEPGDFVTLIFCDRPTGQFRATGRESDPGDLELHGLNGVVAQPGFWPDGQAIGEAPSAGIVVGKDGGAQFRVTNTLLEAGTAGGALDFVALSTAVLDRLQAVYTHALTHTHLAPGGATSAASPTVPPLPPVPASVAATKLKAE